MTRKRNWGSLLAPAKRIGVVAGIGGAVCGFLLQGYALLHLVSSKAAADQETKDDLANLKTVVYEVRTDVKGLAASVNEMKGEYNGGKSAAAEARRLVGPVQRINP